MPPRNVPVKTDSPYRERMTPREIALVYGKREAEVTAEMERQRTAGHSVFAVPVAWRRAGIERIDLFMSETDADDLAGFFGWAERHDREGRAGAMLSGR
ncbi:hypothetical protein [Smaragdicoccus niigatensis]|uniref:hypothetical protein n=1 Tax=Smaragdicoccus niigatensis TaxID=359359 RepID=UPI00039CCB98|nr:hypothetical protein [Smaragdicoccus niigatensis]